jgi:hypothetical protein
VLAECGRRAYQCVSALDLKLGGEPRPLQDTQLSPLRRREIVLCRQMLSQRRQQRVPSLWLGLFTVETWKETSAKNNLLPNKIDN